eukprot:scaffold16.g56.t1
MHYAVRLGGWAALGALGGAVTVFCFSAHLIVAAFDRLPPRAPRTYPELGLVAAGRGGVRMVLGFAFVELAGTSCIALLVLWQLVQLFLPAGGLLGLSQLHAAVALTAAGLVPALMLSLSHLSWLSTVGSGASVAVTGAVLLLLAVDPHRQGVHQSPAGHSLLKPGILQSVGIFCLSASGHSTLPALRAAMARPAAFPAALRAAFGGLLVIYGVVAATGYWYFGEAASPLITTDIALNSAYAGSVDRLLAALVAVNAFSKFPPLVLCLQDMCLSGAPAGRSARHGVAVGLRLALFVLIVGVSVVAYDMLGQAMSLLGAVASIACSLLMPVGFYLSLTWAEQSRARRAAHIALMAAGLLLMVFVTTENVRAILREHEEKEEARHGLGAGPLPPPLAALLPGGAGLLPRR